MGTIEELIAFASLRAGSNVVFANGAARNAVNSKISLSRLRRCARAIENAHGSRCSERLAGSVNYATSPIEAAYLVFVHTDVESDVRDLPGFVPLAKYGSQKPAHEREIGSCEQFRFITSPYFKPFVAAGAAAAAGTILSNGETNTGGGELADVYPLIVMAKSAWGQVALKGKDSVAATHLPASQRNHANPLGQFGYVGADFWKAAVRLNEQWMVRLEVAASAL
jgi:N4-gp56 family major capsid protein